MTNKRYTKLNNNPDLKLTPAEVRAGWHRCPDWDLLLIGPGFRELDACHCGIVPQPKEVK